MHKVFFVGPLPPPVHGFSVINEHILQALQRSVEKVEVFDLAPRRFFSPLGKWLLFLAALVTKSGDAGKTLYLPISGGLRQLVDLAFAIPARWFGFSVFVHHHSFAYLNSKPWFSRLAFAILKSSTHITLCHAMKHRLCQQYGIAPERVRVLSNAAFLAISANAVQSTVLPTPCCTLGFLSNINAEKGIFAFFDALDLLVAKHIPFKAVIAGPVSPEVRAEFDLRLAATPRARHVGAVYGEAKDHFFSELDLLLFPTLYANEAEPVTLWEALAHSVPVVALQRGCIQGIIPLEAGHVVEDRTAFLQVVLDEVLAISASPVLLRSRRAAARIAFETAHLESGNSLCRLLEEMTGSNSSTPSKHE